MATKKRPDRSRQLVITLDPRAWQIFQDRLAASGIANLRDANSRIVSEALIELDRLEHGAGQSRPVAPPLAVNDDAEGF